MTRAGVTKTIRIPMDRRITVMEEIDTMGAPVLRRGAKREIPPPSGSGVDGISAADMGDDSLLDGAAFRAMMEGGNVPMGSGGDDAVGTPVDGKRGGRVGVPNQGDNEQLTLGHILQVFDGILETPGRILIMTTNHPEALDPALVRPGRVDVVVNFERFTAVEVHEMFENITGSKIPPEDLAKIPDSAWSAAQVAQKIFENWEDNAGAIEALKNPSPSAFEEDDA